MKILYILMVLFIEVASSFASEIILDEVLILSNKLQIVSKNEQCFLISKSDEQLLTPKAPCHFLRNSDKTPQYFRYIDVKVDAVLIVIGTPITKLARDKWGLSQDLVCGHEAQGVLIKAGKILVTQKVLTGGVLCRDKGSDEKFFWYFSHKNNK